MKIKWEPFKVKDIAFMAVMAALLILCAGVAMPFMAVQIFGLRNMITAPFYGIFLSIVLQKVRKPGTITITMLFNSAILGIMSPVMLVNNLGSAIVAELIVLLISRSYEKRAAIAVVAGLVVPLTLPISIPFNIFLFGKTMEEVLTGQLYMILLSCVGTVALSYVGVAIGMKIGKELKKAGKLK